MTNEEWKQKYYEKFEKMTYEESFDEVEKEYQYKLNKGPEQDD